HGGGRLDLATRLASSFAPQSLRGEVFAELVYNDKHAGAIQVERFGDPAPLPKLELDRLVVLTGPRTCSASEVLINGLKSRSASLQVVSVGGKTCGKPFGFHPADACGLQYHAVNFMVRNARGQASELDGMTPDCVAGDDYQTPLGRAGDPLVESARYWLSYGRCPTPVQSQAATPRKSAAQTLGVQDGDAPRAMYR
ncbi:MAG: peptidase S41, partial [Betaproteobacteria bacterium]|nr:peptidase S41 [Betaproteobacteria bacterium]